MTIAQAALHCQEHLRMTTLPVRTDQQLPKETPRMAAFRFLETNPALNVLQEPSSHYNYSRLTAFVTPDGFELDDIPDQRKGRSIIYDTGVVIKGIGEHEVTKKWHCLIEDCLSIISIGRNKSNVTDHLRKQHKLESTRTKKLLQARVKFGTKLTKERLSFLKMHPCRYHHLNMVKVAIRLLLPFNFAECSEVKTTIRMLDQRNEVDKQLHSKTVKKIILELYLGTTDVIKNRLKFTAAISFLPFLHLNVDLWTSRVSGDKYFGFRVFFIDQDWAPHSILLAIRKFRPHSTLMQPNSNIRLSDILKLWVEKILGEFGLTTECISSKVSDSGSDVKRLCHSLLPGAWDWCLAHLCNCAVNEAFGTTLNKSSCKNVEVRTLLGQVRKVVEHLHKSANMRARFEDLQVERSGKSLKLLQDQPHRWLGTVRLLERFLLLWDDIAIHYHRTELRPFPVETRRKLLLELFSLMKPISEVMISAQSGCTLTAIDTYLAMCNLYPTLLADDADLPLMDPGLAGYKKGKPVRLEKSAQLERVTKNTKTLLRAALSKRFYDGYNGTARPLTYEMQVSLHPSYRKLNCLDRYMKQEDAEELRLKVKHELHSLACLVAKSRNSSDPETSTGEVLGPPSKKLKGDGGVCGIWNFSNFEDDDAPVPAAKSLEEEVMDEINQYLEVEKVKASDLPSRKLLRWWKGKVSTYPYLSVVARSVLGHPSSSAAIERDFGMSGLVLSPSRSRTDAAFVDMQLFLRAHLSSIPSHVPEITTVDWMKRIPNRFTGVESTERLAIVADDDDEGESSGDMRA